MKIDRSKLKSGSPPAPADCKALIDKLKSCTQEQLLNELKQIKSWTCGQCELYHWVDLLDVFDDILGECCAKQPENQWMLACDLPTMDPRKKELLMHIISFTALLIEHSSSRHLYSSMDHLITLLSSSDMQIVTSVLDLLFVFSARSNFISKLSIEKRQELLTRLSKSNYEDTSRESLLTTSRGYTNYRGLLNLVLILLVLSNARVALENIIKYGILVDPLSCLWFFGQGSKHWPALLLVLNMGTHVLMALLIESLIAFWHTRRQTNMMKFANVALITNLLACIAVPPIVIFLRDTHPISTSGSLMIVSIVFLKLVSWHMVNFWCRDMRRDKKVQSRTTKSFLRTCSNLKSLTAYPSNVSLANISSFMLFPTLCYELEFPRTERIRKRFLIKRIVELLILVQLDIALVQQWIVPTVSNSVTPFRQMQFSHMLERLLKLAIPNHVIWLIWFYLFFHSWLNIVAELTRFADREFYRDWWNSESVYYFWTNWNIPVHKWCARHLYIPLMALGLNKCQASTAVFFVSAFFHEYLVSVPLKMFRMWAFTGMLVQLPWARFVSAYFNNQFANVAVWASLILGQPLCILMYYHDYYVFY